ncbi:MAG: hypothetical protein IJO15_08845 [Clostridia bacterium]|nr:hypothetical protein [Clostridia bacterium]
MILFSLLSLALSEVEIGGTYLSLYPAALLLPVPFLLSIDKEAWPEVLAAAFFGGMLCWKAADAWPLLPGVMLLCRITRLEIAGEDGAPCARVPSLQQIRDKKYPICFG